MQNANEPEMMPFAILTRNRKFARRVIGNDGPRTEGAA
jgi:hypothetical protein